MRISIITLLLIAGCSKRAEIKVPNEVVSSPPPFWPPHEFVGQPFSEESWNARIRLLEAEEDHWNHISFDRDPTTGQEVQ